MMFLLVLSACSAPLSKPFPERDSSRCMMMMRWGFLRFAYDTMWGVSALVPLLGFVFVFLM